MIEVPRFQVAVFSRGNPASRYQAQPNPFVQRPAGPAGGAARRPPGLGDPELLGGEMPGRRREHVESLALNAAAALGMCRASVTSTSR